MDTFRKIQTILSSLLHVSPGSIPPETDLVDDLGADSHDLTEMVMALEDEFGIDIPAPTAATLHTPGHSEPPGICCGLTPRSATLNAS